MKLKILHTFTSSNIQNQPLVHQVSTHNLYQTEVRLDVYV